MNILKSKTIQIRFVEESDAAFILSLRLDDRYNMFLSKVDANLEDQQRWIRDYKKDELNEHQFYFIIERLDGTPCGTVRIYDLRDKSFCWGSWILNENKSRYAAIESAFLVYRFGFDILRYKKSHFDVMKGNQKVISFHTTMGAVKTGEDLNNFYFEINDEQVELSRTRLKSKLL